MSCTSCSQHDKIRLTGAQVQESLRILHLIESEEFAAADADLTTVERMASQPPELVLVLRGWLELQQAGPKAASQSVSAGQDGSAGERTAGGSPTESERNVAEGELGTRAKVAALREEGMQLYSDGLVEAAAQRWQQALELDPADAEAQDLLKRAQRVLDTKRSAP